MKSQRGCTAMIAGVLLAVAAVAAWSGRSAGKNSWAAFTVGGVFGFFGLLCLWSFIRQFLAAGTPMTIADLSAETLQPGQPAKICLQQPGPAWLKSLSSQLVCLQRTTVPIPHAAPGRPRTQLHERQLQFHQLIDAAPLHVAPGEVWWKTHEFSRPADAPVTSKEGNVEILWKIEVHGVCHGPAGFHHPFPVVVVREVLPLPEIDHGDGRKPRA